MLILSEKHIKKLLSMEEAILATQEALRIHAEGKTIVPLRTNIDMPKVQGQSLFMPAFVDEINAIGIKVVSVFPKNSEINKPSVSAQMILLDGETGEVCAMIDGTYLTQLRTGALQGLATDLLARQNAEIAVLIGTGGQAPTQLEAMLTVRKLKQVYIVGRDFDRTKQFTHAMQTQFAQFNTNMVPIRDVNSVIAEADIITAVTTAITPVFDGALVKKGAHINGMGAYTPDMQELPTTIIARADKIYFDTRIGVLAEAGDILKALQLGVTSHNSFTGELGELVMGKITARETEQEITLCKSVGSALFDVTIAHKIYQKAQKLAIGQNIQFH